MQEYTEPTHDMKARSTATSNDEGRLKVDIRNKKKRRALKKALKYKRIYGNT